MSTPTPRNKGQRQNDKTIVKNTGWLSAKKGRDGDGGGGASSRALFGQNSNNIHSKAMSTIDDRKSDSSTANDGGDIATGSGSVATESGSVATVGPVIRRRSSSRIDSPQLRQSGNRKRPSDSSISRLEDEVKRKEGGMSTDDGDSAPESPEIGGPTPEKRRRRSGDAEFVDCPTTPEMVDTS